MSEFYCHSRRGCARLLQDGGHGRTKWRDTASRHSAGNALSVHTRVPEPRRSGSAAPY